jgi:trehalose 6-phosphate phosphatase
VVDALARLSEDPGRTAVILDVDGTLAPIVGRPELAKVPQETRAEVERLAGRYALVACVSGRTGAEAERLVGVEGVVYVGVHALHWREAPDEAHARRELEAVALRAREAGLEGRWGRKVLELRPPVEADKGTAVRSLLAERDLRRALYAGDDTTDLDAFNGLDGLEVAVRVAVASGEAPPGMREAADVVVGSPDELLELLRQL